MLSSEEEVTLSRRSRAVNLKHAQADLSDEDKPLALVRNSISDTSIESDASPKKKKRKISDATSKLKRELSKKKVTTKKSDVGKTAKKTAKKELKTVVKKEVKKKVKDEVKPEVKPEGEALSVSQEEEEEEKYRWWEEQEKLEGEIQWETLDHNGVLFPPDYEPLPKNVKLIYDGKPVDLPLEAEEVAGFYGAMLETDHAKNPVFQKNFFKDFLEVLKAAGGASVPIKNFEKCDFHRMYDYFEKKRELKKTLSKDEKKAIKAAKEAEEEPFKFCTMNGRKEQVGNFRLEPPALFRGRGAHPKTGTLKKRLKPEDITINIDEHSKVPEPPKGHKWAEVKHDKTGGWLAMWKENVQGQHKYVRLAANSSIKGISDFKKFEKARQLKNHVEAVRTDYRKNLKSNLMQERQMAVATYLIDVFALRAGGEKGDEEADTVGCCSLRYEHITLKPPRSVIFDFLGKDSIRFYQEVEVDPQVFKNLKLFKKAPKQIGDQLFDRIDPSILNKHFQGYMPGLTAKVFRTYNASKTMQDLIRLIPNEGTPAEKLVKFNAANREVAILCNHQRTVTKGHAAAVGRISDRIKEMIWKKLRFKRMMLQQDKTLKNKKKGYFDELSELTTEELHTVIEGWADRERDKVTKKFNRDNEKLKLENADLLKDSELRVRLEAVDVTKKVYLKEANTLHISEKEMKNDVEKLEKEVAKIDERITNTTLQLKDKEDNSMVSLSTSKVNYIDPRLLVTFSKKYHVPIEKVLTKTLREKFQWAIESVDETWEF